MTIAKHRLALIECVAFSEVTIDGYFDWREWTVDLRYAPDIVKKDDGTFDVKQKIVFVPRRRLISGEIIVQS